MWILIMVLFNIIAIGMLILIVSNLDNCDKFKVPKYDKNNIFNNQGNWIIFLTPFMYMFKIYIWYNMEQILYATTFKKSF